MKITPLEIRQHTFEKTFRGYEIEEVDSFLASLSQEWDRVLNESKMLRMQLEIAEKEASKLREIEMTLFKTLKTAEDTSTMITNQANQQAEKQIGDAQGQSESIVAEAQLKAKSIIKEAEEKASYVKEEVMGEVHDLQKEFKNLEINKNELIIQLKSLASGTIEHVNRFEQKFNAEIIDNKVAEAQEILTDSKAPEALAIVEEPIAIVEEPIAHVEEIVETPEIVAEVADEATETSTIAAPVIAGLVGLSALAINETPAIEVPAVAEIETPAIEVPAVAEIVAPVIEVPAVAEIVAPVIEVPAVAEIAAPAIEVPAVAEIVAPVIEVPAVAEIVAPVIEVPAVAEIVAPVIEVPAVAEIVAPVIEVPAVAEIAAPVIEIPAVAAIAAPVVAVAAEAKESVGNFFGSLIDNAKETFTDAKETVVESVSSTKPEAAPVINASEQITDEMLERVNKVKLAIKKAMLEKPDPSTARAEEKGGSFFDEI